MNRFFSSFPGRWSLAARILLACGQLLVGVAGFAEQPERSLELSRPVRSWEFVSAVGKRAGLFGTEQGTFEAWVYPLKILRDFHLRFHVGGAIVPAEALARTLIVHPESSTIVYTGDSFSVRETLFVPVHEAGAIVAFEVHTTEPLEIEAIFRPLPPTGKAPGDDHPVDTPSIWVPGWLKRPQDANVEPQGSPPVRPIDTPATPVAPAPQAPPQPLRGVGGETPGQPSVLGARGSMRP